MSDELKGLTRRSLVELAEEHRAATHAKELKRDEEAGHRQDGGISPLAVSNKIVVKFDSNY